MQVSQEAGQVVWYSHLFKNIPQFVVIRTVKDFGIVNIADIDVFMELSCFFDDPLALPFFGIGMKLIFSSPVATAEFSKFVGILSAGLL